MNQFTSRSKGWSQKKEYSPKKDPHYIKSKSSRKVYLPIYLMAFAIFLALVYVYFSEAGLSQVALVAGGIFIFASVKYTEVHRLMNVYEIDDHYLIHTSGLVNKTTKKIFLPTISDLVLQQNPWQSFMNYGTVKVHRFSDGSAIDLKNIPNPKKIIDTLGKRINKEIDIE